MQKNISNSNKNNTNNINNNTNNNARLNAQEGQKLHRDFCVNNAKRGIPRKQAANEGYMRQ